jgi:hypothetical protein
MINSPEITTLTQKQKNKKISKRSPTSTAPP